MQYPSVERTKYNPLYVYGLQYKRKKRMQMPFRRSTGKIISKKYIKKLLQPMKWLSVERTLCNLLNVYGRGRRRCGGPTIQAERFPLVGNAHRAFRGRKRMQMTFCRSTGKIISKKYIKKLLQPMKWLSVERTKYNPLYVYGLQYKRCRV